MEARWPRASGWRNCTFSSLNGQAADKFFINASGEAVFRAGFSCPGGGGEGVFVGKPGAITMVMRNSASNPLRFQAAKINDAGEVAFTGRSTNPGIQSIFTGSKNGATELFHSGDPVPGGLGVFDTFDNPVIGGGGHIAFLAAATSPPRGVLVSGRPGAMSTIAYSGMPATFAPGATIALSGSPTINAVGQIALQTKL